MRAIIKWLELSTATVARHLANAAAAMRRQGKDTMRQTVIPQLRITDAGKSRPFYEALGFKVDWEHRFESGLPVFLQMSRAGQTLFLTEHTGDCEVGGAVYFIVPDVDEYHARLLRSGIRPAEAPENTDWGTREMLVMDPDGNRLRFAKELAA